MVGESRAGSLWGFCLRLWFLLLVYRCFLAGNGGRDLDSGGGRRAAGVMDVRAGMAGHLMSKVGGLVRTVSVGSRFGPTNLGTTTKYSYRCTP